MNPPILFSRKLALLLLTIFINACSGDENNSEQVGVPVTSGNATQKNNINATIDEDIEQYGSLQMKAAEETLFFGQPALVVHFSEELDSLRSYRQWITVSDERHREVSGGWVLSEDRKSLFFTNVHPKKTYTLEIKAGLTGADKSRLKHGSSLKISINNLKPVAGFSGKGMIIPAGTEAGLPIRTINVKHIRVDYFKVSADRLQYMLQEFDPASSGSEWRIERIMEGSSLVYHAEYQLTGDDNQRIETKLPLDKKITRTPGVYFAVMTQAGKYDYEKSLTYFTVSDIGVHMRQYRNHWTIFTSKIKSGEANSEVQIRLLNHEGVLLSEAVTDAMGMVTLPADNQSRTLVASKGEQLAVLNLTAPALDISEFDLPTKIYQQREYFIYGPRDLYRPGEELDFSILLRDFDGKLIPSVELAVDLVSPDGTVLNTQHLSPQQNSYYHYNYQLSPDALTGSWDLRVHLVGEQSNTSKTFLVEDFLPEKIKVDFSVAAKTMIAKNEINNLKVKADYLYGAPAAGNDVSAEVRVRLARSPFPQLKGFLFGESGERAYDRNYFLEDQKLDGNGEARLKLKDYMLDSLKQVNGPVRLDYRASVFESGGRAVERALAVYTWQSGHWSGIKADFNVDDNTLVNKNAGFQLVSVTEKGLPVFGRNLNITLVNLNRKAYWEYFSGDGWRFEQTDDPYNAWQQQVVTKAKPVRIQAPVEKGFYQLRVEDESGNTSTINFRIGQDWWGWGSNKDMNGNRPDKVTMTLDKPAYHAGDSVQVKLQAPRPGKGFLIVENEDGILSTQRVTLGKDAKSFTIKIPEDGGADWKRHDLRLVTMIVQPEQQRRHGVPMRSLGIQPLPIDRSQKKIELVISAPERVEPQTPFTMGLHVNGHSSKEVYITVSAVDQGVLSVTDFKTPDPFNFFYQLRRPQIDARDNFADILHIKDLAFAKLRFGGDATALTRGGDKPESEVLIVSIFKGPVKVDRDGNAKVNFKMPDFNGAVRLMVMAYGTDTFGSAETEVKVSAPVVTQLSMPRFASIGDTTQLTLDIQNTLDEVQNLTINWDVSGARILDKKLVQTTFSLEKNQKNTIKLPIEITQATGVSVIKISVSGEGVDFNRQWILGLRPAYASETFQDMQIVSQGETVNIDKKWLQGKLPESLQLQFSLSPNPPLNTSQQWRALLAYPYGCLEQTTSRARPLSVATEKVRKRWQVELPKDMDRVKAVQDAINRLQTMQRSEGGFGLWNSRSSEELWLTSYVTEFLIASRDRGFQVPDAVLNKALNRLQHYVKSNRFSSFDHFYGDNMHYRFAYRTYAAYILSKQGKAPLGSLRQWFDEYQQESKSPLPMMHLAVALKLQGDTGRAEKAARLAEKITRIKHTYLGDYGSQVRDLAMVLVLNQRHQMNLLEVEKRLLDLSELIYRRSYLSTQERDAILQLAMALEINDKQNPWSARLKVATDSKQINGPGDWSKVIKGENAARSSIEVTGEKKLYVSKTLIANSIEPPKARFQGYNIKREWFDTSGNPLKKHTVTTGEYVIVRLQVQATKRSPDTMIVDLLPAGFELENPGLKHSTPLDKFVIDGKKLTEFSPVYGSRIKHKEYRDDRYVVAVDLHSNSTLVMVYLMRAVTPGTYQVPSAFVEDMYRPENRAVGYPFKSIKVIAK